MARDPRHDRVYRIHFAALGWANQVGHSDFKGERLAEILVDKNGVIPDAPNVSRAIRKAKEIGLIGQESKAACLVLPSYMFQKAHVGSRTCSVHNLSRAA
ncbi:hypothetical protein ABZT45_03815 [Streptomyces sp. NPDC005356]|jgi:hypothetical protein|uniref:hypothetical protein n=1 Tax=Streptomyces sp. NPDC005356 TaxID=3157167 RepID=UPI0033A4FF63